MKTDVVLGMKESYNEGIANHISPESCVDCGNMVSEVLTRESAGWVLSPEKDLGSSADDFQEHGKHYLVNRYGEGMKTRRGRRSHACIDTPRTSILYFSYLKINSFFFVRSLHDPQD